MRKDYYVYFHVCPVTKDLLYIGKGCKTRAWEFNGDRTKTNHAFGTRYKDHSDYLRGLVKKGYLPSEWVKIKARNLTSSAAFALEAKLIHSRKPKFNKLKGGGKAKLTKSTLMRAHKWYARLNNYNAVARKLGLSCSTTYNIITRKTKYYEQFYT